MYKLYFAYGMNTNVDGMARRCPNAVPVGKAVLKGFRLVARGVADITRDKGHRVEGAAWWITPSCERSLDALEGYPTGYTKIVVEIEVQGKPIYAMAYIMTKQRSGNEYPLHPHYRETLAEGYKTFGCSTKQLEFADQHARRHGNGGGAHAQMMGRAYQPGLDGDDED